MRLPPFPGAGGPGWADFGRGIIDLFRQKLDRALWLWTAATTGLPTTADLGANEGAIAYDTTLDAITWYDGAAWQRTISLTYGDTRYVKKAGDTMTGALLLPDGALATPALSFSADTNTGIYRVTNDILGVVVNGALGLLISATGNGVTLYTGGAPIGHVSATGFEPETDNTFYLGRNDDDSPKAWKGLIMKDQTTGTYYRLQIDSGALTLIDLTD
jgi:hypothetical protein